MLNWQADTVQAWHELIKLALLGTERQTTAPTVDESLKPYMDQLYPRGQAAVNTHREAAFLSAAALIGAYYRAGWQPERFQGNVPSPSPASDGSIISDTAKGHLRQMINDKDLSPLLPEWLQAVAHNQQCLAPLLLPQMLDMATRDNSLRPAILRVIGLRGHWLAKQQDAWRRIIQEATFAQDTEMDRDAWETGTLSQRVAYLTQQRVRDPDRAHALLQDTWKQETAKDRIALLDVFKTHPQDRDEAFLETCLLEDKSKIVRQHAAHLLAQLPESAFSQRIKQRLQTWLSYRSKSLVMGALSKQKGQLTVSLPEQWHQSWQQAGISEKAPSGKGQKAWWLEQTLALVAPTFWCAQWNLRASEIVALLHKHEWEAPLRAGLYQATLQHRDQQFAEAWLRTVNMDDTQLWALLEKEQREQLLGELIASAHGGDVLTNLLQVLPHLQHPWSNAFSLSIVDAWQRLLRDAGNRTAHYYLQQPLKTTGLRLHPGAIDAFQQKLQGYLSSDSPNHQKVQHVLDTLRFRQTMLSALEKPVR